ncbi:CDP-glycerol glycerophosphotransferase family protein [Cetobacterium somerae]|nr:CDP-glycerol glycerophosphotransferase family protein [Cetobacterium somerae]
MLKENNYELLFYLHPEAQRFREYFTTENLKVKIISRENVILQELLKESEILITDYSSIAFDFAYMRKKVLYYQFDSEDYYKKHYSKSYFDYEKHGFGEVHTKEENLIRDLKNLLKEKQLEKKYLKRIEEFFPLYDTNNSKRIFQYIRGL